MAYEITEHCIVCGKCEKHCPTDSIDLGDDFFEINPDTCVECKGHYDEPQCLSVCPVECIEQIVTVSSN